MSSEFTIAWKGQNSGPFNQLEIQKKLLSGEITPLHLVLKQGQPIDAMAWASQLKSALREKAEEARRQEEARTAENERLRFHQQENERLQRELKEAQQRTARPLPPPPPPSPSNSPPSPHTYNTTQQVPAPSPKSRLSYVLLGFFLGMFGIHNFYAGYTGRALTQLLLNIFLCWTVVVPLAICIWIIVEICTVTTDAQGFKLL